MIPLLRGHDCKEVIGHLDLSGDRLLIVFDARFSISLEAMLNMFGGAGFRVLEWSNDSDGKIFVKSAEILEFSV